MSQGKVYSLYYLENGNSGGELCNDLQAESNQEGSIFGDSKNEEIIEEDKPLNEQEVNILSSMSRDGMRGPYGMNMACSEDQKLNQFKTSNPLM